MKIPESHICKLENPGFYPWIGTCGPRNEPDIVKCTGVKVHPDLEHLSCFVGKLEAEKSIINLGNNSNITLFICSARSFEGYQYKGCLTRTRNCTGEEISFLQQYRDTFMKGMLEYVPASAFSEQGVTKIYFPSPPIVIEFRVDEIFEQTPKIGTGERLKF